MEFLDCERTGLFDSGLPLRQLSMGVPTQTGVELTSCSTTHSTPSGTYDYLESHGLMPISNVNKITQMAITTLFHGTYLLSRDL